MARRVNPATARFTYALVGHVTRPSRHPRSRIRRLCPEGAVGRTDGRWLAQVCVPARSANGGSELDLWLWVDAWTSRLETCEAQPDAQTMSRAPDSRVNHKVPEYKSEFVDTTPASTGAVGGRPHPRLHRHRDADPGSHCRRSGGAPARNDVANDPGIGVPTLSGAPTTAGLRVHSHRGQGFGAPVSLTPMVTVEARATGSLGSLGAIFGS